MARRTVPERRWRKNPPAVARMRPPAAMGVNHAVVCNDVARRTFSMLVARSAKVVDSLDGTGDLLEARIE